MVFFMFQPFLTEVIHTRGILLENLTHKYAKLAARDGYMSPLLMDEFRLELQQLHFNPADLRIEGTTDARLERGSEIQISVKYPIGSMYILMNWFGDDAPTGDYHYQAFEMSEYIP